MNTEQVAVSSETEFTIDSCEPLMYRHLPVVPTAFLATVYRVDEGNIHRNFNRNTSRFVEGKHFFRIEGEELRLLKNRQTNCPAVKIGAKANSVLLWTERGAARHAKMLETDAAWDVFEKLEDAYFNRQAAPNVSSTEDNCSLLSKYAELDVITSLTVSKALQKDHNAVLTQITAMNLPHDVYHANFLHGEEVLNGRQRISIIAMTQGGFSLLMHEYSGKRAQQLMMHVMKNFLTCQPRLAPVQPINDTKPRFLKRRIDAKRMLALRGALKVYSAVECKTYDEVEAELCAYFALARIEDLGLESYGIAMEYVQEAINRPAEPESEVGAESSVVVTATTVRGALDLWAYYAEKQPYEQVMQEFEQLTGVSTLDGVADQHCLKLLLVVWGRINAALALKEAC
ncbi:ORF6N domain-containing protein [Halodesulfovibrio sp.]|jgi:phage regulator Rha-like protein|uniref:ORF6N domain-containing protein n=1 Tax=Halodesulfovibrio sp. TaxID=1912772 RepID=UPI0025D3D235|nr:ORF6N domain-containing protein [Halodesulfovibrio sp.]MCT4625696.1 ORF6N domain-containing protein [Halodesulfovibrio sp.]